MGQTIKGTEKSEEVDTRPWEKEVIKSYHKHNYNYNFINPTHAAFDIQEQAAYFIERGYPKVPIEYLEIQVNMQTGETESDIRHEKEYVYRCGFFKHKIPKTALTYKEALSRINRYQKDYGLYNPTNIESDKHIKMWRGTLYCLELKQISEAPMTASKASWKGAKDVTRKYLEADVREGGDFFLRLTIKTGGVIEWAYKIYSSDEIGWQLDGLYRGS